MTYEDAYFIGFEAGIRFGKYIESQIPEKKEVSSHEVVKETGKKTRRHGYRSVRWSESDLNRLHQMLMDGKSLSEMKKEFPSRTRGSISFQTWKMKNR